jgi:hypothetical protein
MARSIICGLIKGQLIGLNRVDEWRVPTPHATKYPKQDENFGFILQWLNLARGNIWELVQIR